MTDEVIRGKWRQSDLMGFLILTISTILFAYGVEGFNQWGWVASAAMAAGLVVYGRVISIKVNKDGAELDGGRGDDR